jgi:hypothetical protein
LWLEAGGSKDALATILGHPTIRMTKRSAQLLDEAVFVEARRILAMRVQQSDKRCDRDPEMMSRRTHGHGGKPE